MNKPERTSKQKDAHPTCNNGANYDAINWNEKGEIMSNAVSKDGAIDYEKSFFASVEMIKELEAEIKRLKEDNSVHGKIFDDLTAEIDQLKKSQS